MSQCSQIWSWGVTQKVKEKEIASWWFLFRFVISSRHGPFMGKVRARREKKSLQGTFLQAHVTLKIEIATDVGCKGLFLGEGGGGRNIRLLKEKHQNHQLPSRTNPRATFRWKLILKTCSGIRDLQEGCLGVINVDQNHGKCTRTLTWPQRMVSSGKPSQVKHEHGHAQGQASPKIASPLGVKRTLNLAVKAHQQTFTGRKERMLSLVTVQCPYFWMPVLVEGNLNANPHSILAAF